MTRAFAPYAAAPRETYGITNHAIIQARTKFGTLAKIPAPLVLPMLEDAVRNARICPRFEHIIAGQGFLDAVVRVRPGVEIPVSFAWKTADNGQKIITTTMKRFEVWGNGAARRPEGKT